MSSTKIKLKNILPVGSTSEILNSVYNNNSADIPEIIMNILLKKFDPVDFLAFQLEEDVLTDWIYKKDDEGRIIFPLEHHVDIEPYRGYIGEQTSKYHKENIADHLCMVVGGLAEEHAPKMMLLTGFLHDASKKYETGTNKRGELCFYNHEKTSTYFAASIMKQIGITREEAEPYIRIIYHHLEPFKWSDIDEEMFRRKYGDFVTDNLLLLNKYDRGAESLEEITGKCKGRIELGRATIESLAEQFNI